MVLIRMSSSLNFANRTKKIEVKEIENEPMVKGYSRPTHPSTATSMNRQPLRLLTNMENAAIKSLDVAKDIKKPSKAFSVYSDPNSRASGGKASNATTRFKKRKFDSPFLSRPAKAARQHEVEPAREEMTGVTKADLEELVERKVEEVLAAKAMNESGKEPVEAISEQMQQRLDALEQRM